MASCRVGGGDGLRVGAGLQERRRRQRLPDHDVVGDRLEQGAVHHRVGQQAAVLAPPARADVRGQLGDCLDLPVGHAVGRQQLVHFAGLRPSVPGLDPGDLRLVAPQLGRGLFQGPPGRLAVMAQERAGEPELHRGKVTSHCGPPPLR